MTTHYQRLGVTPDATTAEIRRSWLRLAREHHPDFHVDAGAITRAANEREMQAINDAWAVLSDPDRRRAYDLSLGPSGVGPHMIEVRCPLHATDPTGSSCTRSWHDRARSRAAR